MKNDNNLTGKEGSDNEEHTDEDKVFLNLITDILLENILSKDDENKSLPSDDDKPLPM